MPELRQDPITRRWVVIATERAKRPHSFSRSVKPEVVNNVSCPFCPGHEAETPPEVLAYRAPGTLPDTPGWRVRVVPNLFPAFRRDSGDTDAQQLGPYLTMLAIGAHEVLISSPEHDKDIGQLPLTAVQEVVASYVDRYNAHKADPSVKYILIINNLGREAGASREHPHSQLFAIPVIPHRIEEELRGVARYRAAYGQCGYCDIANYERRFGRRVIYENGEFLVFAPFASGVPFESWVIPKRHTPHVENSDAATQREFADALRVLSAKLARGLNNPPLNYFIHTHPCDGSTGDYHWHLELLPKLSIAAGFELGTDIMINTALPEQAAEFLRGIAVEDTLAITCREPIAPGD